MPVWKTALGGTLAILIALTASAQALAQNTTLTVHNNTSSYVTVSVDGLYGCNTAGHTTCTIPVTVGDHDLHAVRLDSGEWVEDSVYIPEGGFVWTLTGN